MRCRWTCKSRCVEGGEEGRCFFCVEAPGKVLALNDEPGRLFVAYQMKLPVLQGVGLMFTAVTAQKEGRAQRYVV